MPKQVMTGFLEFFVPSIYSFKNGPSSASFWFIFGLFKQTIQNLQQINVKNVDPGSRAGIRTHDLLIMSILL